MPVFLIALLLSHILSTSLLRFPPLYFYICLFLFLIVGTGRRMRFSGMEGVLLGVTNGVSNIVAINPFFSALGWGNFVDPVE